MTAAPARWIGLLALALAGCATQAPPPPAGPPPAAPAPAPEVRPSAPVAPAPPADEAPLRARAQSLAAQGRLADALIHWEVLALLRPDVREYQEQVAQTRRRIEERSAALLKGANDARRRGDLDQAVSQYLGVLAVDRDNEAAASALREIERDRTRRAYLNRGPRYTTAPPPPATGAMGAAGGPQTQPGAPAPSAAAAGATPEAPASLSELEKGVALYKQGNYAGAIANLERHLQKLPQDTLARSYLAEAYFLQGLAVARAGRSQDAIDLYGKARSAGYPDTVALDNAIRNARRALTR